MAEEGSRIDTEHGSSPASRGAAGAYIEGELGALYLLAILTGNRAPGLCAKGVANDDMRAFVATTRAHLVAGGVADEDEPIWRLLRRMLILEFDFEASAPIARTYGLALARMALADEQVARAEALWSRLVDLSIQTGTRGGEIDAAALKAHLAEADFKLAGERDYGPARARLAELAHNTLALIGTSVAGVTLPRLMAVAALDEAAETQRFIVVRGDTGVGKSWVLRHHAERVAARAPIIVLDREATPPSGWLYLANALGIPGSADAFLTDLAASGGAYGTTVGETGSEEPENGRALAKRAKLNWIRSANSHTGPQLWRCSSRPDR